MDRLPCACCKCKLYSFINIWHTCIRSSVLLWRCFVAVAFADRSVLKTRFREQMIQYYAAKPEADTGIHLSCSPNKRTYSLRLLSLQIFDDLWVTQKMLTILKPKHVFIDSKTNNIYLYSYCTDTHTVERSLCFRPGFGFESSLREQDGECSRQQLRVVYDQLPLSWSSVTFNRLVEL